MTAPLTYTLVAMDELVREAEVPADSVDAIELFDAVHTVRPDLDVLHDDLAECLGPIDNTGRCIDCGRLVAKVHKQRGCAMAIPFVGAVLWLADNRYSIPFVGKALWLRRKNSAAGARSRPSRPPAAGPPAARRPSPPRGPA
jgi:hypothetical protein